MRRLLIEEESDEKETEAKIENRIKKCSGMSNK